MDYGAGVFARTDFSRLALRLSRISGRFMLSVNDVPQTRDIFGRFAIEQVVTQYTVAVGKPNDVPEIVVTEPSAELATAMPDLLSL
jgi:DNA adenine methylase